MSSYNVKEIRALGGKTQQELAEILGVSRNTIVLWEGKKTKPKLKYAMKLKELEYQFIKKNKGDLKNISGFESNTTTVTKKEDFLGKEVMVLPIEKQKELSNVFYDKLHIDVLEKEKLKLKKNELRDTDWFKIEIHGENMNDSTLDFVGTRLSLCEGDWAYCKSIPKANWRDSLDCKKVKIFCFFHNVKGVMFNVIKKQNVETGDLLLASLNKNKKVYPDFTINIAECSYILKVMEVLTKF